MLRPGLEHRGLFAVMSRLPSLNALRAFEAVARLGSVSLAGGELSVTPGAISRQIRELETDLGVRILERSGRGIRLTDNARELNAGLQPGFEQIRQAVRRSRRTGQRPTLHLDVVPLFASSWLMCRLKRCRERLPGVDIVVSDRFDEPRAGAAADMTIEWGMFDDTADTLAERLTREHVFPVCGPGVCTEGSLAGATLLHRHGFPSRYDFPDWPSFAGAAGLQDLGGADLDAGPRVSGGLVMDAVREHMGVALVNHTIAHDDLVSGRLVRPVAHALETDLGYWLLTSRAARERPEAKAFRTWLREEIADTARRFACDTQGA